MWYFVDIFSFVPFGHCITDFLLPHWYLLAFLILNTAFRSRRKGYMTLSYDLEGSCKPIQTSLRPPLFIEVPVSSQKSEWSCIFIYICVCVCLCVYVCVCVTKFCLFLRFSY
jgi:hypothetical protein